MARLSQVIRGTRARHAVSLAFGDTSVLVDVRPLTAAEEVEALAAARAYAVGKGLPEPKEGQPVYDLAVMAYLAATACVDHDSPPDAPAPFFDDAAQALLLDRDRLQMLYEAWSAWQEQCSPRRLQMTSEQYAGLVFTLAEEGNGGAGDPFLLSLPRATLVSCMRTMALQLLNSQTPRSPTSSSTSAGGASESPSASP